jgi:DNA-binding response OmpR family regulator
MNQTEQTRTVILAVDDDALVLAELTRTLSTAGYTCHCCPDAEAARVMAMSITPDLIISDINIGGHSGLELCEQLKQQAGLSEVPVMFLSGAQIPDIIRRSHAAGGTYYLRKPFDPHVLVELVDKAMWIPHLVGRRMRPATVS